MSINVILTTYNRVDCTLKCLEHLLKCELPANFKLQIFITDSNSPDNTLGIIKKKYPFVKISNVGNDIFWNQGMRLAWQKAAITNPEYYLWLNDDTYLNKNALKTLLIDYQSIKSPAIITGVTDFKGNLTYGGRRQKYDGNLIRPNGSPQSVTYMNGNCVLVSKGIFKKLGNLNSRYSHSLGDIDYGLTAIKNDIGVYISSNIVGNCSPNLFVWYNPKSTLYNRFKFLFSPKGIILKEFVYFNYTFFGVFKVFKFLISTSVALFFPKLFIKIHQK